LLSVASKWLLTAFAGAAYSSASGLLPWYALGMILLGAVAVFIATHQSRGRPAFLAILLPLTALEPLLIVIAHASLTQVVQVVDVSMALVLAGLAALYVIQDRAERASGALTAANATDVGTGPRDRTTHIATNPTDRGATNYSQAGAILAMETINDER